VGRNQDDPNEAGAVEEVVFDPSAAYAHSEYDHGIMNMFGGFGGSFFKEYFAVLPKTEPADEYEVSNARTTKVSRISNTGSRIVSSCTKATTT